MILVPTQFQGQLKRIGRYILVPQLRLASSKGATQSHLSVFGKPGAGQFRPTPGSQYCFAGHMVTYSSAVCLPLREASDGARDSALYDTHRINLHYVHVSTDLSVPAPRPSRGSVLTETPPQRPGLSFLCHVRPARQGSTETERRLSALFPSPRLGEAGPRWATL